ncbi:MAG: hypothetical protein H7Y32_01590, partial [Chloroflexales bacterium]|nr:hypothetical protein [Chloroflexales bacterium]
FGLLLRVALLPITAHSDTLLLIWQAFETVASGQFSIYDSVFERHGQQVLAPVPWSPYGPAFYYTMGGWLVLMRALGLHQLAPWESPFGVAHLPRLIALVKLFYLLLEVGVVWLLCRVSDDGKPRPLVAALWLLCPFALYALYGLACTLLAATLVASLALRPRQQHCVAGRRWPQCVPGKRILIDD